MKDTVSRVTGGPPGHGTAATGDAPADPDSAGSQLARRVLAEGLDSVNGVVHGALHRLEATRRGERPREPDGRSRRWDAHRAARREELIDAAIEAIRRHGADVGMDQVAATAHTSKPVVYRYFSDKTDLYRAVSQRVVADVLHTLVAVAARNPSSAEIVHAGVDAYLVLLEQNPELFRFVSAHPLVADEPSGTDVDFSAVLAELLAQHFTAELAARGRDPGLAHPWCEGVVGFIRAASLWWLDHPDAMSRDQLADYLGRVLWSGAAALYGDHGTGESPR